MTYLSRLRELSASSTQIKELATKEKESPTVAPVTRGAIKGAATGAGLAGLAGAGITGVGVLAARKANPRALLKIPAVRDIRTILKGSGAPANTPMLAGVNALGAGAKYSKTGAIVGGIGGAFQGARIKGRDEERFKNKEFGFLTKNEAAYDKDGHFTGVENHYNGPGIAEAAGGAALVGAGLGAGHVGVMRKYGTKSVRRTADFLEPRKVAVPVGQAYKKAGSDVLAKIRALAGKRFSAEDRLKELAAGPVAHAILGTANVGAYNAPWGKKAKAYKDGYIHDTKYILGGGAIGGSAGAGIGALVGKKGARAIPVLVGGLGGALAGETAGYIKGIRHPKAKEIRDRHLSAKDRLKELAGGWAMKDGDKNTIYKEPGVKGHLKRHAGLYISTPLALPSLGIAPLIGAGIDQMRAGGNILKTHIDSVNPLVPKLPKHARARASHQIYDGRDGTMAYVPLSARLRLKELAEKSASMKSFDQKVDENGHPILDAAAGAGLGAGAVLGHQAVMNKYAPGASGLAGAKQGYGAAANDFKGGFSQGFNPPSTSAGSGSVATAATNSPLSHDGAKFAGAGEAAADLKKASPLYRAGSRAGGLGAAIRGFLSRMR
jgi:hypothetical protein